jgi:hypothetical protein
MHLIEPGVIRGQDQRSWESDKMPRGTVPGRVIPRLAPGKGSVCSVSPS